MSTKYAIGDKLNIVDLNGKVYRVVISSVAAYNVAKLIGNLEVLAQTYPSPHDTITTDILFYVCESVEGESAKFSNLILWDSVIDHDKTTYITTKSIYRLDIVPVPIISGQAARSIEAVMVDVKKAISEKVPDASVIFTDITEVTQDELARMKAAVSTALDYFDEIAELETIRPLITDLRSIDFTAMTTNITQMISNIQSRLSLIDAGGSSVALPGNGD